MSSKIIHLTDLGQSLWYDDMGRRILDNGELAEMINRGDITWFNIQSEHFQSVDC